MLTPRPEPLTEELEAYLRLSQDEIAEIVLLLLMEEGCAFSAQRLFSRAEQLSPQPVQRREEFGLARDDVVASDPCPSASRQGSTQRNT